MNLNKDVNDKGGYFEENGRIRCVKFRSIHKSEGLFMPLESLGFLDNGYSILLTLKINDTFDELDSVPICSKYIPKKY